MRNLLNELRARGDVGDLPQKYPELTERIFLFSVVDAGPPHWKDPSTAAALKLKVKQILALNGPSRRSASRNRRTTRLKTPRMGSQ